jgi:hypothetical protein
MGVTILEPDEFTRNFVADVAGFDADCKELENRRNTGIVGLRDKHKAELSAEEKNENHIGAAVTEKERALKACTETLVAIQKRDKARQGEIYARMSTAKLSGDSSAIEGLRAELFANEGQTKKERDAAWEEYRAKCDKIALSFEAGQREKDVKVGGMIVEQSMKLKEHEADENEKTRKDIKKKINEFNTKFKPAAVENECIGILADEPRVEGYACKEGDVPPARVRMGELLYDMSALNLGDDAKSLLETDYPMLYKDGKLKIPYCTTFDEKFNYQFAVKKDDGEGKKTLVDRACSLVMRLFMAIPPGKVNFTFIDPIGLGKNFAIFKNIVDKDNPHTSKVISDTIWTSAEDIGERLRVLTDRIAYVTTDRFKGTCDNIHKYNKEAKNAEPYHILMIMDFPGEFDGSSLAKLEKIMSAGPKCGVYTVILKTDELIVKNNDDMAKKIIDIGNKATKFFVEGQELKLIIDGLGKGSVPFKINRLMPEEAVIGVLNKLKEGMKKKERVEIRYDEV